MYRKIGAAVVAFILFAGPSTVSFAQSTTRDRGRLEFPCEGGYWHHQFNTQSASIIARLDWNGEPKGRRNG